MRPRTTVYDLFRAQYTIPAPITISEVHIPIRTIATLVNGPQSAILPILFPDREDVVESSFFGLVISKIST